MLDFLANPKTQHRHKPRIMLKITSNVWVWVVAGSSLPNHLDLTVNLALGTAKNTSLCHPWPIGTAWELLFVHNARKILERPLFRPTLQAQQIVRSRIAGGSRFCRRLDHPRFNYPPTPITLSSSISAPQPNFIHMI